MLLRAKHIFILALVVVTIASFYPIETNSFAGTPFGGRVVSKVQCTCSPGYQVTIQGPNGASGTYLETPSAQKYKYFSLKSSSYLLARYTEGGVCKMTAYPKCTELPISKGTITMFGASF